jgi:hypothetical protein
LQRQRSFERRHPSQRIDVFATASGRWQQSPAGSNAEAPHVRRLRQNVNVTDSALRFAGA